MLHRNNKCSLPPDWEGCNLLQRRKRPSFSLSAARRQMVFYALIFLYTPRKTRDFVSEKLHGQTHLKECIAKRFGSLWISQASHFSGKLNNSLKELCQMQSSLIHCPLLASHKGLYTDRAWFSSVTPMTIRDNVITRKTQGQWAQSI